MSLPQHSSWRCCGSGFSDSEKLGTDESNDAHVQQASILFSLGLCYDKEGLEVQLWET